MISNTMNMMPMIRKKEKTFCRYLRELVFPREKDPMVLKMTPQLVHLFPLSP